MTFHTMRKRRRTEDGIVIGIDAANLRQGGGRTHLIEFLRAADPGPHGVARLVVWGSKDTLALLEDRTWLEKVNPPALDGSLLRRSFWQLFSLSRAADSAACDVVFVPGGNFAARYRPIVTMSRNMLPFEDRERRRYGWSAKTLKLSLLRYLQARSFRHADGLIFLTRYARSRVLEAAGQLPGDIIVVPHGVSNRFAMPPRRQRSIGMYSASTPYRLLYVSAIDEYKHQWHVVEAVARLRRQTKWPLVLDVVGPAYRLSLNRLNAAISRWDPQREWVRYHGEVSYEDLHKIYREADLGIFASSCENMPNILLEMMSAGLPIASSNRGPMPEILQVAGCYFDPEAPSQIMGAVERLISSPDLRRDMATASHDATKAYSWRKCAAETLGLLAKVARRGRDAKAAAGAGAPVYTRVSRANRWPVRFSVDNQKMGAQVGLWRRPDMDVRIRIDRWVPVERIRNQYIERPRDIRLVWNYLWYVGPKAVLNKIVSRRNEALRNRKVAALGSGEILECSGQRSVSVGDHVVFFAPNQPADPGEHVVIDERFVLGMSELRLLDPAVLPVGLAPYVGWSAFSGRDVDVGRVQEALEEISEPHRRGDSRGLQPGPLGSISPTVMADRVGLRARQSASKTAVLFGLGNYAKTQIIPNIDRRIRLECIHEMDPDQLRTARGYGAVLDTAPVARPGERYDVWFIAGYHHTHADLALCALARDGAAVVEKPLATTWNQLALLREAMAGGGVVYACFHKRYGSLNQWVERDFPIGAGEPIDMHAIVYEIPLPPLHWYNWPNSGSRIISNGCHWLDYFLFVNGYSRPVDSWVRPGRGSDMVAGARLENGARLVLSLTETGSHRLGVREVIELRAANVTARIVDGAVYEAESSRRRLGKHRCNPMSAYSSMYQRICLSILQGSNGDPVETLRSTELMLRVEDQYRAVARESNEIPC